MHRHVGIICQVVQVAERNTQGHVDITGLKQLLSRSCFWYDSENHSRVLEPVLAAPVVRIRLEHILRTCVPLRYRVGSAGV